MNRTLRLMLGLAAGALATQANAYEIPIDTIAPLGGISSNGAHIAGTSAGLPLAGIASNGAHQESVGFWRWFAPATSDVTPSGPGLALPSVTRLVPGRPNPFHSATRLPFEIAGSAGTEIPVRIEVFDVLGRSVRMLVDEHLSPGAYSTEWNARDSGGHALPTGVYFARLQAGSTRETVRLVMAR